MFGGMPNMAGVDNNMLKNQANMIAGMDDTQLQ